MMRMSNQSGGRSSLIVIFCVIYTLCLGVALAQSSDSAFSENEIDIDGEVPQDTLKRPVTQLHGGEIIGERILRAIESPYIVTEDIEVPNGAKLTIEPGVTIEFAPSIGITVRGVIHAVVSGYPILFRNYFSAIHLFSKVKIALSYHLRKGD